jgi:hypothetical protein
MTSPRPNHSAAAREERAARWQFARMLLLDVGVPLALYYVLRGLGASPWTALVLGAAIPLVRVALAVLTRRRLEMAGVFTLILLAAGTAVGLLAADPRLLMARESYLTAVVGVWILVTLWGRRPMLVTATAGFMPPQAAAVWHRAWDDSPRFRRAMRGMTLAFGLVFLADAAARVVMAYTLPLDLVPLLSVLLLVAMLIGVVQGGKGYGRRHLSSVLAVGPPETVDRPDRTEAGGPPNT